MVETGPISQSRNSREDSRRAVVADVEVGVFLVRTMCYTTANLIGSVPNQLGERKKNRDAIG